MNDPMKILIAYDGSACADTAIDDLVRAGLPAHVDVLIATVAEVWAPEPPEIEFDPAAAADENVAMYPPAAQVLGGKSIEDARALAMRGAERLKGLFPEWHIRGRILTDSPARGVLRAAEEFHPDLIVVGSHGRSLLGRLILGSVSQKVLYEAASSVRIARSPAAVPGAPVRIVVGVDASGGAMAAVQAIAARHWPAGSAVRIVSAIGPTDMMLVPPVGVGVPVSITEAVIEERTWLANAVEEAKGILVAAGLLADGSVIEAAPIPAILDEAAGWGADAIFVGAKGHDFMERFVVGSVSAAVAARAGCTVEVVRTA